MQRHPAKLRKEDRWRRLREARFFGRYSPRWFLVMLAAIIALSITAYWQGTNYSSISLPLVACHDGHLAVLIENIGSRPFPVSGLGFYLNDSSVSPSICAGNTVEAYAAISCQFSGIPRGAYALRVVGPSNAAESSVSCT